MDAKKYSLPGTKPAQWAIPEHEERKESRSLQEKSCFSQESTKSPSCFRFPKAGYGAKPHDYPSPLHFWVWGNAHDYPSPLSLPGMEPSPTIILLPRPPTFQPFTSSLAHWQMFSTWGMAWASKAGVKGMGIDAPPNLLTGFFRL